MSYKTELWVSFNYGAYSFRFLKTIELDFAPFYGLTLFEQKDGYDHEVEIKSNEYCESRIAYAPNTKSFVIEVKNWWKNPVTDDTIDYTLSEFRRFGYKREDTTDALALKRLMEQEYNRRKKFATQ